MNYRIFPIMLMLAGCDAQLSRFDRVDAYVGAPKQAELIENTGDGSNGDDGEIDPGAQASSSTNAPQASDSGSGPAPVVDVGADVLSNIAISRTVNVTAGSPTSYQWRVTSGPEGLVFSAPTSSTTTITGALTGIYVIEGSATDAEGRSASDSFTLTWDVTPPANDVQALSSSDGTTAQTITIDLTLPLGSDYSRVDIRRVQSATAPTCTTGVVSKSYTGSFPASDSFLDDTGGAGRVYSYRACVYDEAGNVTSGHVASRTAKAHTIFATSKLFNGLLVEVPVTLTPATLTDSGPKRADHFCQLLGATLSSDSWRAILSDDYEDARTHIVVTGSVVATDASLVASDAAHLFDPLGTLSSSVFFDETGGSPAEAWTGSEADGRRDTDTCGDWTSAGAGDVGRSGDVDPFPSPDFHWISANSVACSTTRSLYCISQAIEYPFTRFNAVRGDVTKQIDMEIDVPTHSDKITRVDVYRSAGGVAPDSSCDTGTLVKSVTTMPATTIRLTDATPASGAYSYRACAIDPYGNVLTSKVSENIVAN